MRLLGVGLSGIQVFCSVMELEKMNKNTFYSILKHIHIAAKAVSEAVFKKAVNEEKQKNVENGYPEDEITVSGDGSWTKRGFTSLLGIVSLIGKYSNKIVDVIVKSKVCKACEKWSGKEKTDEYLLWYEEHKDSCTANHEGSSGKMEVDGIIEMFKRSVPQFDVKYKRYIGDGDSKTFTNLLQADPYDGNPKVEKKECVLHVKKRMYRRVKEGKKSLTQFSKAKKQFQKVNNKETEEHEAVPAKRRKMKRDSSVKSVHAKVKTLSLTNKLMIKLSTYYGLAILRNSDSVEEMNKAVWATFFHLSSTDKNPQHSYCPQGLTSWCEYQKFKAQNQQGTFTHPPAFDDDTAILKPIYEELSSNDLLERCLGKNNQNNNESFNHCVWNLAPKHIFVGKMTLEIATLTAACVFNEGFMPVLKIMETMGVTIGPKGMAYAQIYKDCRIQNAEKSTSDAAKLARSSQRSKKVAENEVFEETEGLLYAPGIAD